MSSMVCMRGKFELWPTRPLILNTAATPSRKTGFEGVCLSVCVCVGGREGVYISVCVYVFICTCLHPPCSPSLSPSLSLSSSLSSSLSLSLSLFHSLSHSLSLPLSL